MCAERNTSGAFALFVDPRCYVHESFPENHKISLCLNNIDRRDIMSREIYISCL